MGLVRSGCPDNGKEKSGSVSHDLSPRRSKKTLRAMKAPYAVKRITFIPSEANPGEAGSPGAQAKQKRGLSARLAGPSLRH